MRCLAIAAALAFAHLAVTYAQFYPNAGIYQAPRQGSLSRASSNAYRRELDYGPIDVTQGVSNSRVVTKNNGGFRNGGTTSVANTNAITRGVNVAGLPIEGTFSQTQTRNNGAVSRGVGYDLNVGNFGIDTSLSRENLNKGFGLQRDPNGGLQLGLGLLNIDLSRNAQQQQNTLTQAQVNAQGQNARVRANSNTNTQSQQYGGVGVRETYSQSNAFGRTRFGQTNANAAGLANGASPNDATYGNNIYRSRRAPTPQVSYYQPIGYRPSVRRYVRPKRSAQFLPFGFSDRPRRQFGNSGFGFQQGPGFRGPQSGFGYQQPGFGFQQPAPQKRRPARPQQAFNQQAGANTHSNNMVNQNGFFQDNGASSIGSNLAQDGSRGQVSSANVAQMNQQTADGIRNSNNAQSQSLNFGPNQQQATSTNAGTLHTRDRNSERLESNSGSQSTNNNEFGSSSNIANTNSAVFQNGNQQGANSDASSQSIFQGANGQNANALTNSKTSSVRGPNGFVSNSASSNASAVSQNGGNASANAVSNAGTGADGANAGAGAQGGNGNALANSGAFGNFNGIQSFGNAQRVPNRRVARYAKQAVYINITDTNESARYGNADEIADLNGVKTTQCPATEEFIKNTTEQFHDIDVSKRQARTFQEIGDFINGLLGNCVTPCTIDALRQNRCCEAILVPPLPLSPPGGFCCQSPPYLLTRPIQPLFPTARPQQVFIAPPIPQLNCCNFCTYNNYGMPPCWRYGRGGYYGGASVSTPGNIGLSNANSITIQVAPPYYG